VYDVYPRCPNDESSYSPLFRLQILRYCLKQKENDAYDRAGNRGKKQLIIVSGNRDHAALREKTRTAPTTSSPHHDALLPRLVGAAGTCAQVIPRYVTGN
jgi:hypothetical protein